MLSISLSPPASAYRVLRYLPTHRDVRTYFDHLLSYIIIILHPSHNLAVVVDDCVAHVWG